MAKQAFVLADFLHGFFRAFEGMPHRGSGTYHEARAARLLGQIAKGRFDENSVTVIYEPFTVDLSSGTWNVAVHGLTLGAALIVAWGGGLVASSLWSAGRLPAALGFLGTVPFVSAALCLVASLFVLWSRFRVGKSGWNLASLFWPKADSTNVIVTNLSQVSDPDAERLRANHPKEYWTERFKAAHDDGIERVLVLAAHYDTARSLPPHEGKSAWDKLQERFLWALLHRGIGLPPTISTIVLGVASALAVAGALFDPLAHALAAPWVGWVVPFLALVALLFVLVEAVIATLGSRNPLNPGFNDNLSGVATILGALSGVLPPGKGAPHHLDEPMPGQVAFNLTGTCLMAVFTGSEENGLRGSMVFAREVLAPAYEVFGQERLYVINVDSVSGGVVAACPWEVNLLGAIREGNLGFARQVVDALTSLRLNPARVRAAFGSWPIGGALDDSDNGHYSYKLRYLDATRRLPACTDLTGFTSPYGLDRRLCAFSFVSCLDWDDESLHEPRDYHQLSDTIDILFAPTRPDYFATVVALALCVQDLVELAETGRFDLGVAQVRFKTDSASLVPSQLRRIDEIAQRLERTPKGRIVVSGHSAATGTSQQEQQLSNRRAEAVADELVRLHPSLSNRINRAGHGSDRPLARNATRAGRARNRRVEVTLE